MPLSSDIFRAMEKQPTRMPSPFAQRVDERRQAIGMSINALADQDAEIVALSGGRAPAGSGPHTADKRPPGGNRHRVR